MRNRGNLRAQLARKQAEIPMRLWIRKREEIAPGSGGLIFLPYMAGERSPIWDSKARGVQLWASYEKTRAWYDKSQDECGLSCFHNLKTAEEAGAYVRIEQCWRSGKQPYMDPDKGRYYNKSINVPGADYATTLGAAIFTGVGTGIYGSFDEAVKTTVQGFRRVQFFPGL